jgi:hypothetical protein
MRQLTNLFPSRQVLRVAERCFALSVGNLVSYLFPLSRFPRLQEDGLPTGNGL